MKQMRNIAWISMVVMALFIGFSGCGTPQHKDGTGVLALSFDNGIRTKNIEPDVDMAVATYDLSATGPDAGAWTRLGVTGSVTVPDLLPGDWTVTVVAKNGDGVAIGGGSSVVTVVIGTTVSETITVNEYSGNGTLALDIDWYPPDVSEPVFQTELKDKDGVSTALTMVVDEVEGNGTYSGQHEHGFYTLITRLYDDTVHVGGIATVARIVAGHTSTGMYTILINKATGQMTIDIDNQILDFLHMTPSVPEGNVPVFPNQDFTISFSADDTLGTVVWYLNGIQAQVGGTDFFVNDENYAVNTYNRLDVVAYNVDGSRAGSLSWMLIKQTATLEQSTISGTFEWSASLTGVYRIALLDLDGNIVPGFNMIFPVNTGDDNPKAYPSFEVVPPGQYHLRISYPAATWETGTYYRFYGQTTNNEPDAPNAGVITIPHAPGETFNVGTVNFQYGGVWIDPSP